MFFFFFFQKGTFIEASDPWMFYFSKLGPELRLTMNIVSLEIFKSIAAQYYKIKT